MLDFITVYLMVGILFACMIVLSGRYTHTKTSEFTKKMSDGVFLTYCFIMIILIWPKIIYDNL